MFKMIFFLDFALDYDGYRIVHTENCPNFNGLNKGEYLGAFNSSVDAVRAARYIYPKSKGCVFCCHLHDETDF